MRCTVWPTNGMNVNRKLALMVLVNMNVVFTMLGVGNSNMIVGLIRLLVRVKVWVKFKRCGIWCRLMIRLLFNWLIMSLRIRKR